MNEAILATDLEEGNWRVLASTYDNSANWGFDRFRIYTTQWYTRVGVFSFADYFNNIVVENTGIRIENKAPTYGSKVFSSTGSFEHDFFFDLSFNTPNNSLIIAISALPSSYEVQQIYATPTGYSATTGRNAKIREWDFSTLSTTVTGGGVDSSILWKNQPLEILSWNDNTRTPKLLSKTMEFQNCLLIDSELDKVLIWTDAGGVLNGTLNYSGNTGVPTNASKTAYDNLISKGWTITGTAPPIV